MEARFAFIIFTIFICISTIYTSETRRYEQKPQKLCCVGGIVLSPWALSHYKDVRIVANIMRQQYFLLSQGSQISTNSYTYPIFGGRSQEELGNIVREHVEYIINEIHSGRLSSTLVTQTNFFEQEAASVLERLEQEQKLIENQHVISENDEIETINNFGSDQHFTYPTEVHMTGDKTYILKKNCTTTTTNNLTPVTIVGSTERKLYNESYIRNNHHAIQPPPYLGHSMHSIYNYLNRHESQVPSWTPQVVIDEETNNKFSRTPAVVIPVAPNIQSQVETFDLHNMHNSNNYPNHFYNPGGHSTVTIKQFNRTIITGPDGKPIVKGGESETRYDNGKVVFNNYRPFGDKFEEDWKKTERERLFWLFQNRIISDEEFQNWQFQEEERLHNLAYHYNTTIEEIEEWQRQELNRFNMFVNEETLVSENLEEWQKKENVRLKWLIQQNSLTKKELENWQRKNQNLLIALANEYRITISQLKEWQKHQLDELYMALNFQNNELDTLKKWQNQEKDRLYSVIRQHNVTVEELQEQIRRDQVRLQNLSEQYHVNIAEMESWLKNELNRLTLIINEQQREIQRLTEWQKQERFRLEKITQEHNLTVEELKEQLKHDKNYLKSLAHKYHISIEELEAWQRNEIDRLKTIGTITIENELKEWQQRERERLMLIAQQNDYTIEEFEKRIKEDRIKLQLLAEQYQVRVEEIEEWVKKESNRLHSEGILKNVEEELNEWQTRERDRLLMIIKKNEINVEELERKIINDNQHLNNLALKYQIQVREVEEWVKKEIERLKDQGLIKIENLEEWQKSERQRLNAYISQNQITIEEFEKLALKDRNRLQNLAHLYQVQLEELESFIKTEINRIKFEESKNLGQLKDWQEYESKRLEQIVRENQLTLEELKKKTIEDRQFLVNLARDYHTNINEIEQFMHSEINRLNNMGIIKVTEVEEIRVLTDWQQRERDYLYSIVNQNSISVEELEKKIKEDRYRLEKLAYEFHITVEEIEEWLKNEVNDLLKRKLIYENERLTEWQRKEREYLEKLIMQQTWTLEELERKLKYNQERLRTLALQYQISIVELQEWYDKELNRLKNNQEILSESLIKWHNIETDRIYQIATQHVLTLQEIQQILWQNERDLRLLAQHYQTTVTELKQFQISVLENLLNQGIISNIVKGELSDWQNRERERLNYIVENFIISEEEFLEFLRYDREFNVELAETYGISIENLESWHVEELRRLQDENKLDNTDLINLQYWQKRERDRLYMFIWNQQMTINDLKKWQSDLNKLQSIAEQYNIHVNELREWQLKELKRLYSLAYYYRMSIKELAEFRQSELERLKVLAHKVSMSTEDYTKWFQQEQMRFNILSERYNLSLRSLENWRRTLFLLSQGLIHRNFDETGGEVIYDIYNVTAKHNTSISLDRGDQPPNVFVDDYDDQEPNIYGHKPTTGPIQEREPTTFRPHYYPTRPSAALRNPPLATIDSYGRSYQKKVTTSYTVPIAISGNTEITSGSSYNYNSQTPPIQNVYYDDDLNRNNREKYGRSINSENYQKSQHHLINEEQDPEIESIDLSSNFDNDEQQRLLQTENFEGQTNLDEMPNENFESIPEHQQSIPENYNENKENLRMAVDAQQIEEEQPTSLWGKMKKKTKDFFG